MQHPYKVVLTDNFSSSGRLPPSRVCSLLVLVTRCCCPARWESDCSTSRTLRLSCSQIPSSSIALPTWVADVVVSIDCKSSVVANVSHISMIIDMDATLFAGMQHVNLDSSIAECRSAREPEEVWWHYLLIRTSRRSEYLACSQAHGAAASTSPLQL